MSTLQRMINAAVLEYRRRKLLTLPDALIALARHRLAPVVLRMVVEVGGKPITTVEYVLGRGPSDSAGRAVDEMITHVIYQVNYHAGCFDRRSSET